MIEFFVEADPTRVFKQIERLLQRHMDEVCMFGDDCMLAPDWVKYRQLSDMGMLNIVSARNEDGDMVGYCSDFIIRHMHYAFVMASNDAIYLLPEHRGVGGKLIKFVEKCLTDKGVRFYSIAIKPQIDFSPIVKRMGYKLMESHYYRRLQ